MIRVVNPNELVVVIGPGQTNNVILGPLPNEVVRPSLSIRELGSGSESINSWTDKVDSGRMVEPIELCAEVNHPVVRSTIRPLGGPNLWVMIHLPIQLRFRWRGLLIQ